jgi:hypothetical protein
MQQDAEWGRPPKNAKDKHIENFIRKAVEKHFEKHKEEVGAKDLEDYKRKTREVLEHPDRVFISLVRVIDTKTGRINDLTYWHFFKGKLYVGVSENNYSITTFHRKESIEKWAEQELNRGGEAGIIELR